MNIIAQISENVLGSEVHTIVVSKRRFNQLERYSCLGGFKRYHVELYNYTESKNTKLKDIVGITSKWLSIK